MNVDHVKFRVNDSVPKLWRVSSSEYCSARWTLRSSDINLVIYFVLYRITADDPISVLWDYKHDTALSTRKLARFWLRDIQRMRY